MRVKNVAKHRITIIKRECREMVDIRPGEVRDVDPNVVRGLIASGVLIVYDAAAEAADMAAAEAAAAEAAAQRADAVSDAESEETPPPESEEPETIPLIGAGATGPEQLPPIGEPGTEPQQAESEEDVP